MHFTSAISDRDQSAEALDAVISTLRASGLKQADVMFVFLTSFHVDLAEEISRRLSAEFSCPAVIGVSGEGVIGGDKELEREPGLSVLAGVLPGVRIQIVDIGRSDWDELLTSDRAVRQKLGWDEQTRTLIGFADPLSTPIQQFMERLNALFPGLPLIGGMASAGRKQGENVLLVGGDVVKSGFVGVTLSGPLEVETIVSQGCRPIGRRMIITKAHDNMLEQLGGRPALQVVREMIDEMSEPDQRLLGNGLFIGRAISEYKEEFGRGDFLIRGVMGVQESTGAIAVSDFFRIGQTVQFHARDAFSAHEELSLMLEGQGGKPAPAGGLLFSCNGRGMRMFSDPNHDIGLAKKAMASTPMAGFFAAGELGPVGGKNFIHGHTASFALFRPIMKEPQMNADEHR